MDESRRREDVHRSHGSEERREPAGEPVEEDPVFELTHLLTTELPFVIETLYQYLKHDMAYVNASKHRHQLRVPQQHAADADELRRSSWKSCRSGSFLAPR